MLAALREMLPDAPVIYAADYGGLPYGEKSEAQIAARVAGLLGRMSERFQPRLACIACNTASTIALGNVREVLEIPVVGTVPAIKPAASLTRSGAIGLIGTQATIRQKYVDDLERDFAADKSLLRIAAPGFVAQAEAKMRGRPVDQPVIEQLATELRAMESDKAIDTLVLACTHFPLLREELALAFGANVHLVDGAQGIARRIADLTKIQKIDPGQSLAVTTGDITSFKELAPAFARMGIDHLEAF